MNDNDVRKLVDAMKEIFPTMDAMKEVFPTMDAMKEVFPTMDAMKEVFPTAEMVARGFGEAQEDRHAIKRTIAEVSADLTQLTSTVEDLRERVAKVPTTPDMERLLEKTYNLANLQAKHNRMKKIMQDKLGVEV